MSDGPEGAEGDEGGDDGRGVRQGHDGREQPEGATVPRRAARPVDAHALARHAARLMQRPAPWLHGEVARRMAERLQVLKRAPQLAVDWGAHLGASEAALRQTCPRARRVAVEAFAAPASSAGQGLRTDAAAPPPWWSARRWWPATASARLQQSAALAPHESKLPESTADLLWSNMVLHHLEDPEATFARWLRLLSVDGILMFSTLGPGTLATLRRLYASQRWPSPHAPFVDMHDLGDMLVHAGFADPVMDQEVITLTWGTPAEALAELRQLGGNAGRGRFAGLRTPRWRVQLEQALVQSRGSGERIVLEFEVVYGHAVRPEPRAKLAAETAVTLDHMRDMLRSRAGART